MEETQLCGKSITICLTYQRFFLLQLNMKKKKLKMKKNQIEKQNSCEVSISDFRLEKYRTSPLLNNTSFYSWM